MRQLWGDCHTHSRYSDGLFGIPEQTPFFEAFGDDFRFQTDHLIVRVPSGERTGEWLHADDWPRYAADCALASTPRHVCVPGVELGWEVEPARRKAEGWFDAKFHPRPGEAPPAEEAFAGLDYAGALRALRQRGRVIIAHADQGAPLALLAGDEMDGLELRWDIEETRPLFGRPSLAAWDAWLAAGRRLSLSAGSDGHQPDEWAGSALRTVVLGAPPEGDALVAAVAQGRTYLSGTWHPDCFGGLGCPEHANVVAGGVTRFTPWWDFKTVPGLQGRDPREVVERALPDALSRGRCRREDYPVLAAFAVGGEGPGGAVRPGRGVPVTAAWRTHAPVREARLIADGRVAYAVAGPCDGLAARLDLREVRSVRLEVEAEAPADPSRREGLLVNPVYVA